MGNPLDVEGFASVTQGSWSIPPDSPGFARATNEAYPESPDQALPAFLLPPTPRGFVIL